MSDRTLMSGTVAAVFALAFAVLVLFGFAVIDPLRDATDDELRAWWSDSGNQRDAALSMYFLLAAAPCFVVFAAHLASRLRSGERGDPALATFVFGSAVAFAVALSVAAVARGAIGQAVRFDGEALPGIDAIRYGEQVARAAIGVFAMGSAAITVAAASAAILRTKALGAWLGWAGLGAAAVTLVFVVLLEGPWASPIIQLWVLAAGVELFRVERRARSEGRVPAAQLAGG
jgi:hypothetical protein